MSLDLGDNVVWVIFWIGLFTCIFFGKCSV